MDNYGTVDNPAWISTVSRALMKLFYKSRVEVGRRGRKRYRDTIQA